MGRNTILREIKMDDLNSDLYTLENLSKKISDLIYNNEFSQISFLDAQRRAIIEKIKNSKYQNKIIKKRIRKLVDNNFEIVKTAEENLKCFSDNHHKYNNRLKAYSFNK